MAEMMNLSRYVQQRKKKMAMTPNPSRDQGRLGIPKNASPDKWDAPADDMRGGRGGQRAGYGAYGPTEPYSYSRTYDNKTRR